MNSCYKRLILILAILTNGYLCAATYHVDALHGNDSNNGLCHEKAFKTLLRCNTLPLKAGDSILLNTDSPHRGFLMLDRICGTKDCPVVISAYNTQQGRRRHARIDARHHMAGVFLRNCSHITVSRLSISADGGETDTLTCRERMRCGVLVKAERNGIAENIILQQLHIQDVFYHSAGHTHTPSEVRTANGTQPYGWGIRILSSDPQSRIDNVYIGSCTVENVGHTGIKCTGNGIFGEQNTRHIILSDNTVTRTGGPGLQFSCLADVHITRNTVTYSGSEDDSRKWGRGSGMWTWGCDNVLIDKNRFLFANGPADSAGAHIDYNCRNVIVEKNFSAYNAGGFCEILGSNHHCAYRYNISVNDGFRQKGVGRAFQEGKSLWTSGYSGKKRLSGPFDCYIYNNTIYTDHFIPANRVAFANTSERILIANNIICYRSGRVTTVAGDQYKSEQRHNGQNKGIILHHNLFLDLDAWNRGTDIHDSDPLTGDPRFLRPGGLSPEDYLPLEESLIRDRGIRIRRMKGDRQGLKGGEQVQSDIMGTPIDGAPDMGAIEFRNQSFFKPIKKH